MTAFDRMADFAAIAHSAIDGVAVGQRAQLDRAADLIAESLLDDGVLQAYGTGHSRAIALELAGRAGGLVPANQLAIRDVVYYGQASPESILDPLVERDPRLAHQVWELADIRPSDVFVIASNSGGNGAIVEMAMLAKKNGHSVVAITSAEHSARSESRHASGKKLADLADVVIDNGAPYGDAVLPLAEGDAFCAVSTVTGALIAQLLVAGVVQRFQSAGVPAPIYRSANTPGGYEHNEELLRRYGTRVRLGDA